jgi:hypothetical protein
MFTIKVIEQGSEGIESEQVFEASGVRSDKTAVYVDLEHGQAEYRYRQTGEPGSSQTMFVMNRFGATVADYRL